MAHVRNSMALGAIFMLAFIAALMLPAAAFAEQSDVSVTNHTTAQDATTYITDITIGNVDAPTPGEQLDDKATVTTAEGETWDIPTLWVDSDLQLATEAAEGRSYLPALAFYLPSGYAPSNLDEAGAFKVSFSKELAKLFGDAEVISVYDTNTGITYILPSSLRDFFVSQAQPTPAQAAPQTTTATAAEEETVSTTSDLSRLVDLYCSQSAKDALSQSELEYLVDLILYRLQPQAVNLLREKFPAFDTAAFNGEIGTQLGFYVYYGTGDDDGDEGHATATPDNNAYVIGRPTILNGSKTFVYLLGVNAAVCSEQDSDGNNTIIRSGKAAIDFQNTIVHEMFHAFMDDYNRAGMVGATSTDNLIFDLNNMTAEQSNQMNSTRFPLWFIEGTASSVENVYSYRHTVFEILCDAVPSAGFAEGSKEAIYMNYLTAKYEGKPVGFELMFSRSGGQAPDAEGNLVPVGSSVSRYVTGYLAVVYLSSMAANSADDIGNATTVAEDGTTSFSTENICAGLNSILERMHNGETLDSVIADISKDANGTSLYTSTDDFESKFICGPIVQTPQGPSYASDDASLTFVASYLDALRKIDADESRSNPASGTILFDMNLDLASPLDPEVVDSCDVLTLVENNSYVESTVPNSQALATGGKSASGAANAQATQAAQETQTDQKAQEAADTQDTQATQETAERPATQVTQETAENPEAQEVQEVAESASQEAEELPQAA